MKSLLLIIFFFLTLGSCNDTTSNNSVAEHNDAIDRPLSDESLFTDKISWLDSSQVIYAADTFLTHKDKAFMCDSAIAVDYTGFLGEYTFMPLNEKGQWISTIEKRKKLTDEQLQLIQSVLGDKTSFDKPLIVSCYEPRIGIIYLKDNKAIGQSAICLGCARLESTAKLGNGDNYSSFNERTLRRLETLCSDLQFSDCKDWLK